MFENRTVSGIVAQKAGPPSSVSYPEANALWTLSRPRQPNHDRNLLLNIDADQRNRWLTVLAQHQAWLVTVSAARLEGDRHQAEEIVADFISTQAEQPVSPDELQNVEAWLYRSVVNRTIDWLRRRNRWHNGTPFPEATSDDLLSPESCPPLELLIRHERSRQFQEALYSLCPDDIEILTLKYMHDWNYAQIGKRLELDFSRVANRLRSARNRLKAQLMQTDFCDDLEHLGEIR